MFVAKEAWLLLVVVLSSGGFAKGSTVVYWGSQSLPPYKMAMGHNKSLCRQKTKIRFKTGKGTAKTFSLSLSL